MNLGKLLVYFDTSPAIRLLRSQHAPYVLAFLHRQFKQAGRLVVPHGDLLPALASYLEMLAETYPDALKGKPETYLADWCTGDRRWLLRRFGATRTEPEYELSPSTEEVLALVDRALSADLKFIATESRLHLVIGILHELVVQASDDPAVHLERLRNERQRIDQEIAQIESDGFVSRYHPARIRERFAMAVTVLKELQGDFRAVEEKFREITVDVQQRHLQGLASRGGILGEALDAEEALKREDQGVSFFEFLRFIHSPSQQDRLRSVIQQLLRIEELAEQAEGTEAVRRMVPSLLAEAEKVTQTTRRLTSTLRRLLDARSERQRQRVAELLREIQALAVGLADDPPSDLVALEVDAAIEMNSPWARTFWSEPVRFEHVDLTEHAVDDQRRLEFFRHFAQMDRLDWRQLRGRVREATAERGSITLGELLDEYPPESGVVDVLGYLQIASDDGHMISHEAQEEVRLPATNGHFRSMVLTVPRVTFMERNLRCVT